MTCRRIHDEIYALDVQLP